MVYLLKKKLPSGIPVEYGFLEFADPTLTEALDRLRNLSVKKVLAVPAMLFAAGHAKNDIPSLLNNYSNKTGLTIKYGRELGVDSLMISASGARIQEVIEDSSTLPNSETLLLVVGRGSSDPDANSNVSKITRMLVEAFGFGWGETVYSGVTFPLVASGLKYVVRLGFKRIIVFPYFLFSGVLLKRIRNHTQIVANENPQIEFLSCNYLGSHPLVVETFLNRIQEIETGKNLMNCSLCKYRSQILGFENEVGLSQQSHHHHHEGASSIHDDNDWIDDQGAADKKVNSEDLEIYSVGHTHHFPYPQAEHPLGPVSLREQTSDKSKEK